MTVDQTFQPSEHTNFKWNVSIILASSKSKPFLFPRTNLAINKDIHRLVPLRSRVTESTGEVRPYRLQQDHLGFTNK